MARYPFRIAPCNVASHALGWPMTFDTSTLYLLATMVAGMLGAMLVFFGKQERIPALKWWGAAYLLGAASVAVWTVAIQVSAPSTTPGRLSLRP